MVRVTVINNKEKMGIKRNKRSHKKILRKVKKYGFKRNSFGSEGLLEGTKKFLSSVTNYLSGEGEKKEEQSDEELEDSEKIENDYDEPVRTPIEMIEYHSTTIQTALVIIGAQNIYIKNKEELLVRLTDLLEIAKDRITNVYNIIFSGDLDETSQMYSNTNFMVPKLLTDTFDLSLNKPVYIVQDNHYFKPGPKINSLFAKLQNYDKIIIVSFLDSERDLFIKQLMSSFNTISRKIGIRKEPKVVLLKDLDSDLIVPGLNPKVETVSITHALDNDNWTSDILLSRTRNSWTDEPDSVKFADPNIDESNRILAKSVILKRSKLHSGPVIVFKEGLPQNPYSQEFMFSGRGSLPYYGPNFITYIVLSRRNNYDITGNPIIEILVKYDRKGNRYDLIHYFDAIDVILKYLHKVLGITLYGSAENLKYEGVLKHDSRETKNAWVEASLYNWSLTNSNQEVRLDHDHYQWIFLKDVDKYINFDGRRELRPVIGKISI